MADSDNDNTSNDMAVPETMRIAALLAELMPSGGLAGGKKADVTTVDVEEPAEMDESPATIAAAAPAPVNQTPPPLPAVNVTPAAPIMQSPGSRANLRLPPTAMPVRPPSKAEFKLDAAPPKPAFKQPPVDPPVENKRPLSKSEFKLEAMPPKAPAKQPPLEPPPADSKRKSSFESPKAAPDPAKPKPEKPAKPAIKDDDLIPLGDLSVSGYFSLVNWRNEPEQAKHPRRSDYGLDEQTLALARLNPFYLIGQPRRPETRSVANVLSEISWE
jgi:hypothetical protein